MDTIFIPITATFAAIIFALLISQDGIAFGDTCSLQSRAWFIGAAAFTLWAWIIWGLLL